MKIIDFIANRNRAKLAATAGISESTLNNMVSQKREVLELANGDFILTNKQTIIFKANNESNN